MLADLTAPFENRDWIFKVFAGTGIPSGPYGNIVKPMLADLTADAYLLSTIVEQNQLHNRTIDHAIENPDTVVDDCEVRVLNRKP